MSDQGEWALVPLDEKMARRMGVPHELPVPKDKLDSLASEGLTGETARKWITEFLKVAPTSWRQQNNELATRYDRFLGKAPHWDKAQKAFAKRDFPGAIKALSFVGRLDPEDHAAKFNLAMAHASSGDTEKALELLKAVDETFRGDPDYHVNLGHLMMGQKDRDGAIEQMVLALEASPECKPAMDTLMQLGVLIRFYEDPRDASSLVYVRKDSVLACLEEGWDESKPDEAQYLRLIAYHQSEGRHEVVLAAAERAIRLAAGGAGVQGAELARIRALRALGKLEEATTAAQAYVEKAAGSAGARVELGCCLVATGKAEEGRSKFQEALELDPGDQEALVLAFWPEDPTDIEKVHAAIPALKSFAEKHPDHAGTWRSVARAHLATGNSEEALGLFAKAVELTPEDDDLRAEYWGELAKAERFDEVLVDAGRIDDIRTRDWKLRWNEAEAYSRAGKQAEARAAFAAINMDESLHVDVRKRAKRAAQSVGGQA